MYANPGSSSVKTILITAVWFGIVTGLVEGFGLWALQQKGWLAGTFTFLGASIEIVWIATIFDLLLFTVFGLTLSVVAWFFPKLPVPRYAIFLFAFLAIFDWLAMPLIGRTKIYAIPILAAGLAAVFYRQFVKHENLIIRFWRGSLPWFASIAFLMVVMINVGLWLQEKVATANLPNAAPDSPNILVIVVDTLRADHLSSYGYSRPTSPNIDQLANQGVLFENAISTSSWTQPAHASILTGRYVYEHGADGKPLDNRFPTIGEALIARGYLTGAFSANFEAFNRSLGYGRGFIHFEDYYRSVNSMVVNTLYGRLIEFYLMHKILGFEAKIDRKLAPEINQSFLNWLDNNQRKPFFAFLNYFDAHDPYMPPQPYRSKFSKITNPGGLINTNWDMNHIYVSLTSEQLQGEIDAYDGAIAYIDEYIGKLFIELEDRGLAKNSIIVVLSDHGEMFGEHDLLHHANSLYREVIEVPLTLWWPDRIPSGIRIKMPISIAAIPETLEDLIGTDEDQTFQSLSLVDLWKEPDSNSDWPNPLSEVEQEWWVPVQQPTYYGSMKSIISPQWHYIVHEKFGDELYDLTVDPKQLINQAENPDLQTVADQFRLIIESLRDN